MNKRFFTKRKMEFLRLPELMSSKGMLYESKALRALYAKWRAEGATEELDDCSQDGLIIFSFPDGEAIYVVNPRQEFAQAYLM